VVVQRYDPTSDSWQVLKEVGGTSAVFALDAVDSGVGTIIASLRAPDGERLIEVAGDGTTSDIITSGQWGRDKNNPDLSTRLCPRRGGALLYRGSSSDVATPEAAVAVYSSASKRWSEPVVMGPDIAAGLGGTTVCTSDGIAVFGYPTSSPDVGLWAVFSRAWVRSTAPSFAQSEVMVPSIGVFFDGALWSLDADGRWKQDDLVIKSILTGVEFGEGRLAALVSIDGSIPRLQINTYR
jgi:hypothetical protein